MGGVGSGKRGGRKSALLLAQQHRLATKTRVPVQICRFAFSEDGVYVGDGEYRWWREFDDSGYGWSGQFDIITKAQLKERIHMAKSLGFPVYHKEQCGEGEEHELYTPVELVAGMEDLL